MRVDYKTLKIGDVFYECGYGHNIRFVVTKPSVRFEDLSLRKWKWSAKTSDNNEVDFLITEGLEHYGPKIYSGPAYVTREGLGGE